MVIESRAMSCVLNSSQVENRTIRQEIVALTPLEKACRLAWGAVKDELSDSYTYKTIVEEGESNWVFTFLPEARVRGGGARVKVNKEQLTITEIVFHQ